MRSAPFDTRVEQALQDVDGQVQDHEEQRQHQDRALQQRQVALEDGCVEQKARARPGKDGFDQNGAAQQVTQLQAHHGQRGGRGGEVGDHVDLALVEPFARQVGGHVGLVLVVGGHHFHGLAQPLVAPLFGRQAGRDHGAIAGQVGIHA
ncbi:hypothetical protein G6F59_015514 [Rhizopus arrhizus]|nr:hypothetical protein G6F59_015514 [Rhizopus arrhizus]